MRNSSNKLMFFSGTIYTSDFYLLYSELFAINIVPFMTTYPWLILNTRNVWCRNYHAGFLPDMRLIWVSNVVISPENPGTDILLPIHRDSDIQVDWWYRALPMLRSWGTVHTRGLLISKGLVRHIEAETKWPPFSRRHCEMDLLEKKKNIWTSIKISLKFVPMGPFNNSPALVQTRRQAIIWINDA